MLFVVLKITKGLGNLCCNLIGEILILFRKRARLFKGDGEKMLNKIKELPEKLAFFIGLSLTLFSPIILLLMSFGELMTILIQAIVWGVATLFILSAADKRHFRKGKNK